MWLAGMHVTGRSNQFWVVVLDGPPVLQTGKLEGQSHSSLLEPTQGHPVPQVLGMELWSSVLALLA